MAGLEISLLGGFLLRRDGTAIEPIPARAARSVFAYLVMNRDRTHTRDLIAGTFWPDLPDATARRRLSQALWHIQSSIGSDPSGPYILSTSQGLRFNPDTDYWIDADEFEWTLDQAARPGTEGRIGEIESLEAAVRLYRGDLLAGSYDDWMVPDQERLRERFMSALDRLAELTTGSGDYAAAMLHARRLAQHDPFREEAHRMVMRLAVLLGRHNEAIRQFETCRRILQEELGTTPSQETLDLYQATLRDKDAGRISVGAAPDPPLFDTEAIAPFVGRDRERTVVVECLDAALEGRGGVVLVEGESGVGKTRLLTEIAADARWRGMDVLWGGTSPSGGPPYEALAAALADLTPVRARQLAQHLDPVWRETLAPLAPLLAAGPGQAPAAVMPRAEEQARMREAVTIALLRIGSLAPALIVLEDVHWADDDTIQTINRLSTRVTGTRTLIAVSYRHGEARERSEVWDLLRSIDRIPDCERVSLSPCSPAQTEELIRRSLGLTEVGGEFSERVHRQTGGNPLFVIETLRALYEQDRLEDAHRLGTHTSDRRPDLPVTPAVHSLIRDRLDGLDEPSLRSLETIAVHDGHLTLTEIVTATETEDAVTIDAVDDLLRRRIVTEHDGGYAVGHELLRRVVYDHLSVSTRLDLHRRVALAVELHRPGATEVLAFHFEAAHMPEFAARYHEEAADRALQVHAYAAAVSHLDRAFEALETLEAPREDRYRVATLHEEVLDTLARRDEQDDVLLRMARTAGTGDRADVARRRAWWLAHQDRFPEAEAEAKRSLGLAREHGDGGKAVAALSALGLMACYAGRAADGVAFLEEAALLDGADARQRADARNALGQNLIDLQRFQEAEEHLQAALTLYEGLNDARGRAEVLGMLGTLHMERGEPERAEAAYRQAIDMSRSIGYRHGEAVSEMNLGILYALANRVPDALVRLENAASIYDALGNRRGRGLVLGNSAWLRHAVLGDHDRAEREAVEALSIARGIDDQRGEADSLALMGTLAAARGSISEALGLLSEAIRITLIVEDSWLAAQALREMAAVELRAGYITAAVDHASQGVHICEEHQMGDLEVSVRAMLGRALLATGRIEEALIETSRAMMGLGPAIDFGYQVPLAHALVLEASGDVAEAGRNFDLAYTKLLNVLAELTEEQRSKALTNVLGHREVVEQWQERRPQQIETRVAAVAAPSGRPLRDDELVPVTWTIGHPGDGRIDDPRDRRRHRIVRLLTEAAEQGGAPTVGDLAAALGSSPATIRRDLAALRAAGRHVATRGTRTASHGTG